jgi:hypothetical protein
MDRLTSREARYTKYSYIIFIYGIIFIPLMVMNFYHGTRGTENIPAYIFSTLFSVLVAVLLYSVRIRMNFTLKFLLFFIAITIINLFIWSVFCDGTFIYRD